MWSLTSTRAKRISGPKNPRPSDEKDFCNTICHKRTFPAHGLMPSEAAEQTGLKFCPRRRFAGGAFDDANRDARISIRRVIYARSHEGPCGAVDVIASVASFVCLMPINTYGRNACSILIVDGTIR